MRQRIKREPAEFTSPATEPKSGTQTTTVLPGANWVCERKGDDGLTLLPLIGWEIVDGEAFPLPRSLGDEWLVRPVMDGDERLIRQTAARLRPKTKETNWSYYR